MEGANVGIVMAFAANELLQSLFELRLQPDVRVIVQRRPKTQTRGLLR